MRSIPKAAWIVSLVALLTWSWTITFGFVWDDLPTIVTNPSLHHFSTLWRAFTSDFWGLHEIPSVSGYWRPLPTLVYFFTVTLFGVHPEPLHAINVLLHGANAALVTMLLQSFGISGFALFGGALIWALHPLHAEAVSFISTLPDLLAAFFGLVGLLLWKRESGNRRVEILGLVFFGLAFLSKESALIFPWIGFWLTDRPRKKRAFLALSLSIGLVGFHLISGAGMVPRPLWGGTIFSHLRAVGVAFITAISLALFPWGTTPTRFIEIAIAPLAFVRKNGVQLRMGAVLFIAFWLPVSNLVPLEGLFADRYLYLPLIGIALIYGALFEGVRRPIALAILFIWIPWAIYASSFWRNEEALWKRATEVSPKASVAWDEWGRIQLEKGNYADARTSFEKALSLRPNHVEADLNLQLIRYRSGEWKEALVGLERLLEKNPTNGRAWDLIATILIDQDRQEEARDAGEFAVRAEPTNWKFRYNLALTELKLRDFDEARALLQGAAKLAPDRPEVFMNLAASHFYGGDVKGATAIYEEVLRRWPDHEGAKKNLETIRGMK